MKILITGASGNVGQAILRQVLNSSPNEPCRKAEIFAGLRNVESAERDPICKHFKLCAIDFEKAIYPKEDFDAIFLLRPPKLAKPEPFRKYLATLKRTTKIVFLSVQGADTKSYLPHAKIEKMVKEFGFEYVFIRPTYFMENLTTTLWEELVEHQRIFLPASDASFNWIALKDVADAAIKALTHHLEHNSLEAVGESQLSFQQVVAKINTICGTHFQYVSPSLLRFIFYNIRNKKPLSYIFVMILLHYLPKFSSATSPKRKPDDNFKKVIGRSPTKIETFIEHHRCKFQDVD